MSGNQSILFSASKQRSHHSNDATNGGIDNSDNESINSDYIPSSNGANNNTSAHASHDHTHSEYSAELGESGNEEDKTIQPYSKDELPPHACAYCGIHHPSSVVKCNTCNRWFCNSKLNNSGSHIITHLVMSRHNTISLHPDSDLGDTTLECYHCGNKNVFILGYVTAKSDTVVIMLCRLPCAQSKDIAFETDKWQSLIENRQLLTWIAQPPNDEEVIRARPITPAQIAKLEAQWRMNRNATIEDVDKPTEEDEVEPILIRYTDAYQYQKSFSPLIDLESEYDKQLKESQALEHISVKWSLSLSNRHLARFALSTFESNGLKVAVGDEMILRHSVSNEPPWECKGYIVRLPNVESEEFVLELAPSKKTPPTHATTGFTAEFVWKGTSYDRMQQSLKRFAMHEDAVSPYIYHTILGHDVAPVEFKVNLPSEFSIRNFAKLNTSQTNAVKSVLQRPLSLIQGPPGTGKTVTSATIVYHLSKITKQKILVCAPSNVAVDHLADKLDALGLSVVRLTAKSREDAESSVTDLALHNVTKRKATGELKKLIKLKEELGELSNEDNRKYLRLTRLTETQLLKKANVVCTTCVGAGDRRLNGFQFPVVLIDESTQSSEPECLIPIVKGARQVVLVGDHQQLGPVILEKKAGDAGLKQSLFERLVVLGHIPIRLEVQYRMNPCLSEFPSNMFYEGSLQNGVTGDDRLINNSFPWPIRDSPMMFWANYGKEEISASGTSYLNRVEAMNCEKLVTRFFKNGIRPSQIGIITPYEGQRAYVVQYMTLNGSLDKEMYAQVEVASVDAFQGREKDFIILSCVRANDQQVIGFLSDPRRLNVALTRAKYGLVVLGNPRALAKNFLWNHLLVHFREKGCLVEGPLDNLQLSSVQLNNPVQNRFKNRQLRNNNADGNAASAASAAASAESSGVSNGLGATDSLKAGGATAGATAATNQQASNFFNFAASNGLPNFPISDFDTSFAPSMASANNGVSVGHAFDNGYASFFQSSWPLLGSGLGGINAAAATASATGTPNTGNAFGAQSENSNVYTSANTFGSSQSERLGEFNAQTSRNGKVRNIDIRNLTNAFSNL